MLKLLIFLKKDMVTRNGIIYHYSAKVNRILTSTGESFTKLQFILKFKDSIQEFKPYHLPLVDYLEQEHQDYISKVTESGMPLWLADQLNYQP
jgi:hypothetical protein